MLTRIFTIMLLLIIIIQGQEKEINLDAKIQTMKDSLLSVYEKGKALNKKVGCAYGVTINGGEHVVSVSSDGEPQLYSVGQTPIDTELYVKVTEILKKYYNKIDKEFLLEEEKKSIKYNFEYNEIEHIKLFDTLSISSNENYELSDDFVIQRALSKRKLVEKLYSYLVASGADIPSSWYRDSKTLISKEAILGKLMFCTEAQYYGDPLPGFYLQYNIDVLRNSLARLKFSTLDKIEYFETKLVLVSNLIEKSQNFISMSELNKRKNPNKHFNIVNNNYKSQLLGYKSNIAKLEALIKMQNALSRIKYEKEYYEFIAPIENYITLFPEDIKVKIKLAWLYRKDENFNKASKIYTNLYEDNTNSLDEFYFNLSNLFLDKHELKKSIYFWKRAVSITSMIDTPFTTIANAYYKLGEVDSAFSYWLKGFEADSLTPVNMNNLGVGYRLLKDSANMTRCFQNVLDSYLSPLTLHNIGEKELAKKFSPLYSEKAVSSNILSLKNNYKTGYYIDTCQVFRNISQMYFAYGFNNDAVVYVDSALVSNCLNRKSVLNLKAKILFGLKQYQEAILLASKGAFSDCKRNDFVGRCYFEMGNMGDAIKYARLALDSDSTNKSALSNMAWYLLKQGNGEIAYKYINKAVLNDSFTASRLHTLAMIEYSLGKFNDAYTHFEDALERDPLMVEALFEYGKFLIEQNKASYGLKLLHRASILHCEKADEFLKGYFEKSKINSN